ncbi:protein-glutamine glutaminase family protein [Sorangium sp. So ce375]|uniref:protein-glutamine glutaminase family protein n=1 Tax=Sorangium sp. So ce375 TaxID=3133306 RepID=UPI003F5AE659
MCRGGGPGRLGLWRLVFQTTNEPSGTATWSHHVAPVVRVGGQLMILDVAIDPSRPLPIAEWPSRFSVADDIDVAISTVWQPGADTKITYRFWRSSIA